LEYTKGVLSQKITEIDSEVKKHCNHPTIYKYGRVSKKEKLNMYHNQYTPAKINCTTCGTTWIEGQDNITLETLEHLVENAIEINGRW
jgi:hypothetical protein